MLYEIQMQRIVEPTSTSVMDNNYRGNIGPS